MKKYISAGLTLILMVIWTVAGSLVSIAEKTDTVMQVKAVTTIDLGDKAEGVGMTRCDSPVGITNIQGVKIDATGEKVTNNAWSDSTTLNRYAEIQLNTSLAGAEALLIYFKMPKNSEYPNLYFCCGGANAEGAAKWCKIAKDNPYYVLEKSDPTRTWTERKAAWEGGLELPADFDGFLYFPLLSLGYTENDTINVLQFWLDTFGGDAGPGVFGGFMLATNAERSSKVLLPDETISRDFFTGKQSKPAEELELLKDISSAVSLPYLRNMTVGTQLTAGTQGKIELSKPDSVTVSICENPSGLGDNPGLSFDNIGKVTGNAIGSSSPTVITLRDDVPLKDKDALLFYVKLPQDNVNAVTVVSKIRQAGQDYWPRTSENQIFYTLKKGEIAWQAGVSKGDGRLPLESGFEGYVRLPLSSLNVLGNQDPFTLDPTEAVLGEVTVYPFAFGGENGQYVVSNFMLATNALMTKNGIVLDGEEEARNMFTGQEVDPKDILKEEAPVSGETYTTLPTPTTEMKINIPSGDDLTGSTAKVTWQTLEGAASYRLDLYEGVFSADGLAFKAVSSQEITEPAFMITGLTANVRYYVVVYALTQNGRALGIYDSVSFTAESIAPVNPTEPDEPTESETDESNDIPSAETGESSMLPVAIVLFVGSLIVTAAVVRRKGQAGIKAR